MMPKFVSHRVYAAWLVVIASCHHAPPTVVATRSLGCEAAQTGATVRTTWSDDRGSIASPSPDSAAALLAGEYDVLQFATEGTPVSRVLRWRMRLVATNASVRRQSFRPGLLIVGGARIGPGAPFDSARAAGGRLTGRDDVSIVYHDKPNDASLLVMWMGIEIPDGGQRFEVSAVDGPQLRGRWTDGGIGISLMEREGVRTVERLSGFFCATRVSAP